MRAAAVLLLALTLSPIAQAGLISRCANYLVEKIETKRKDKKVDILANAMNRNWFVDEYLDLQINKRSADDLEQFFALNIGFLTLQQLINLTATPHYEGFSSQLRKGIGSMIMSYLRLKPLAKEFESIFGQSNDLAKDLSMLRSKVWAENAPHSGLADRFIDSLDELKKISDEMAVHIKTAEVIIMTHNGVEATLRDRLDRLLTSREVEKIDEEIAVIELRIKNQDFLND